VDIFSTNSGTKVGSFDPGAAIPWLPTIIAFDEKGKPIQKREMSAAFTQSKDTHSIIFRGSGVSHQKKESAIPENKETAEGDADRKEEAEAEEEPEEEKEMDSSDVFDILWNCPDPELGTVVMVVNFCFTDSTTVWHQLRYSLRESAVRLGIY
jgi:hypothetical protein